MGVYLSLRRKVRKTHTTVIFGACMSGYRTLVCGCAFHKGGKASNAHAPTWASIRAVHATLSLSFVTHVYIHTHSIRARTYMRASFCTYTYICTHVSWNEKAFRFCNVDGSTFWWLDKCVHPGDISSKLHIVQYIT